MGTQKERTRGFQKGHVKYSAGSPPKIATPSPPPASAPAPPPLPINNTLRMTRNTIFIEPMQEKKAVAHPPKPNSFVFQDGFFVGLTSSVMTFLHDLNKTRRCSTRGCDGKMGVIAERRTGLGGSIELKISCRLHEIQLFPVRTL